jgi:ABC-2 type transport system ATP-binding protein
MIEVGELRMRFGPVIALLSRNAVHFSEVSAHRATLEDAYMDLTRDAVEFRAGLSEHVR